MADKSLAINFLSLDMYLMELWNPPDQIEARFRCFSFQYCPLLSYFEKQLNLHEIKSPKRLKRKWKNFWDETKEAYKRGESKRSISFRLTFHRDFATFWTIKMNSQEIESKLMRVMIGAIGQESNWILCFVESLFISLISKTKKDQNENMKRKNSMRNEDS